MSQAQMYQALLSAVKAVPGMIPMSTPGTPFTPPTGAPYADVSILPSGASPFTLGEDGEDRHDGVFQILLKYPPDKGVLGAMRLGDTLRESFKAGHRVFYEQQEVVIRSSSLGTFSTVDGRLVNPFTVYWYALTRR